MFPLERSYRYMQAWLACVVSFSVIINGLIDSLYRYVYQLEYMYQEFLFNQISIFVFYTV